MKRCVRCRHALATDSWQCADCGFAPSIVEGIPVLAPELAHEIAGFDNRFFETHGNEEAERSFWPQARSALLAWSIRRYAPSTRSLLEIGCGSGGVLAAFEREFPAMQLVGAEALIEGLRMARTKVRRTTLLQFDARDIPFDDHFDAVGAFDVIEHIRDDDEVMRSMTQAIRPGGVLMLTVPQHPWLFGPADVYAKHQRRYTAAGLRMQVERLGLSIVCLTSFVSMLFPMMAAVRLASKWRGGDYEISDEFKIGPLNSVFGGVMDFERLAIKSGMRFPFGGSLLLMARKNG